MTMKRRNDIKYVVYIKANLYGCLVGHGLSCAACPINQTCQNFPWFADMDVRKSLREVAVTDFLSCVTDEEILEALL